MGLKLVVDKIEDVEEALRPLYVEKDGKFHLDADDIPDVAPLQRNLEAARRAERAMKNQVEKWEKLGKTDEEIAALISAAEKNEQTALERAGEWDKLKEQMNERHRIELEKREASIEAEKKANQALNAKIRRYLVDSKATSAIAAAEGEPELLLDYVKRFIKVEEDEHGEFFTSIVDDKGGARVNGKGDPLTVDELLAEMRSSEKLGRAFKASGSSGSSSAPGGGSNPKTPLPPGTPKSWADAKTPEDKAKYILHQKTLKGQAA